MSNTARNWIGIAGVCLVFVFGMVAGASLTIQIERARAEKALASGHLGELLTERLTRRLTTKLRCDSRQSAAVRAILLDAQHDMQAARRQIAPQLKQVFFQTADRVRDVLRGDQIKTFDEIMARFRARGITEATSTIPTAEPSSPAPVPKEREMEARSQ